MVKTKKSKSKKIKIKTKITKDMTFSEILTKYPRSAEVMMNYGLHCIGCQVAAFETLQEGAKAHGMTNKELNKMIDDLNKLANEKEIKPKEEILEENLTVKEKPKPFFKRLFRS